MVPRSMRDVVVVVKRAATHERIMNGRARENEDECMTWESAVDCLSVPLAITGWAVKVSTRTDGK